MKPHITALLALGFVLALSSCATKDGSVAQNAAASNAPLPPPNGAAQAVSIAGPASGNSQAASQIGGMDLGWPRVDSSNTTTVFVFQPRIDSWDGWCLAGRSAVAVQDRSQSATVFGVIMFQANTLVDKTNRLVTLENVQITCGDFPSAPEQAQQRLNALREQAPRPLRTLSLDYLEMALAAFPPRPALPGPLVNNNPPRIILAYRPAILVSIDGPPAYRPVPGTGLQRVINTRVLLFRDAAGQHYLHLLDGYVEAPSLDGPWTAADRPPQGAAELEKQARSSMPVELLERSTNGSAGQIPKLTNSLAPEIYVATTPTELVDFDGSPSFVLIPDTQLLYAANTTGNFFTSLTDRQFYVLLAGRWFRSSSWNGPWQFVPGTQLPRDFANIPASSPKENVKASVPGTSEATEALIANSIPQSGRVPRTAQMRTPRIDGPPQIKPIEGTPLSYVANSDTPIIKVDEHSWYACQHGVWFAAASLQGRWAVAPSVPPVIYSIPLSSPLHYVTYVRIYSSTPDYVEEGFAPGYLGTEVASDGTVVYGSGYDYPPWIGSEWYGPPETWGLGWDGCWTPWSGWCFGCGFGWPCFGGIGLAFFPPAPCWGPYRDWWHDHGRGWGGVWEHGRWAGTAGAFYHRGDPGEWGRYNYFGSGRGPLHPAGFQSVYDFGRQSPGLGEHGFHANYPGGFQRGLGNFFHGGGFFGRGGSHGGSGHGGGGGGGGHGGGGR